MAKGAELKHEVGNLEYHKRDPLVRWMDLNINSTRCDVV